MPRKILAVLFLVAAGLGTWFALGTNGSGSTTDWESCLPERYDCRKEAFAAALKSIAPRELAENVYSVFEKDPKRTPSCHQVMHEIGQVMADDSVTPVLGDLWSRCSYGMLHGVYETLPLPDDTTEAGSRAYAKCAANEEISATRDLAARCEHALGHSLWRAMDADLEKAAEACMVSQDKSKYENCLSGVFMMDRETNWDNRPAPITLTAWRNALAECPAAALTVCILVHAETAVFDSETAAQSWLKLCLEQAGTTSGLSESVRCAYMLGQGQTFVAQGQSTTRDKKSTDPGRCVDWTAGLEPEIRSGCLEGALNALAAIGTPEQDRRLLACRMLEGTDLSC